VTAASRTRLDVSLVERGLAPTRERARALVMAGRVRVRGSESVKPGMTIPADALVELVAGEDRVGRGGHKLAGALDAFGVDPAGRVAVDVGASTGGFTEVLLERGATRVYAVDVGRAQLHQRLRDDPRVVVLERVNARALSSAEVPETCGIATMDVSFISVLRILPALRGVLATDADAVILVKPQFEVGKGKVGKGGVVRDPLLHAEALHTVAEGAVALSWSVAAACASPITGAEGNREFFLHLRPTGPGLSGDDRAAALQRAVAA
jgi:23S rRNA (cytidine1920-2'-O)/16S rRNA (cytidine1409-2'-O)-methyltransferase